MSTRISWELGNRRFDNQRARDFLADRYERAGEKGAAGCIRLGMPVDHDSHVALLILHEFLAAERCGHDPRQRLNDGRCSLCVKDGRI